MQYLAAIRSLERQFKGFTLQHVDRAKNEEADALAKAVAEASPCPPTCSSTSSARQPSEAPKGSK
jgi:ribonuclease HI